MEQIDKKTSHFLSICFQVQCCEVFYIEWFVNPFVKFSVSRHKNEIVN